MNMCHAIYYDEVSYLMAVCFFSTHYPRARPKEKPPRSISRLKQANVVLKAVLDDVV
jgi:hypothetical protein